MSGEVLSRRIKERREDYRESHYRKNDVTKQDGEIENADQSLPGKGCVAVEMVVRYVAAKEQDGEEQCGDHSPLVNFTSSFPDVYETKDEAACTHGIEEGVCRR